MDKKTDQAVELFKKGDIKGALRIAKSFRKFITRDEKAALERGYEMFVRPDYYKQLGRNPQKEIDKAVEIFKKKWVE